MNIIFMGTPEFSVPILKRLALSSHKVLAVVSQPDREKDKKGNLIFTPVKCAAMELGIEVLQMERVSRDGVEKLKSFNCDFIVTAAFGQLLSSEVLAIPKYCILNVHASLLPKYRGSSPIQSAILNGDKESGVTIMKTELAMDTGAILKAASVKIDMTTTFGQLHDSLCSLGGELLIDVLDNYFSLTPVIQDDSLATYTKKITKADGLINFNQNSEKIARMINAFNPWPSAYAFHNGKNIKIYESIPFEEESEAEVGTVLKSDVKNGLVVKCGLGAIKILLLQAPGHKKLKCEEFLKGYHIQVGDKLRSE